MDATGRLLGVWTPRGLQDSTLARGVPSRARLRAVLIVVCWRRQHFVSFIRRMPMWSGGPERAAGVEYFRLDDIEVCPHALLRPVLPCCLNDQRQAGQ